MFTVRRRLTQLFGVGCLTALIAGGLSPAATASGPLWRDALAQSVSDRDSRTAAAYRTDAASALAPTSPDEAARLADDAESGYADGDRVLPDRADELRRNAHAGATTIQAGLNEDPSDTRLVSAGRSLLAGERRSARIMLTDARLLATSDRDAVDVDGAARAVELAEEAWTAGKPVPAITHYGRAIAATLAVVRRHGVSYDDTADLDGDGIPDLAELRAGADPRVSDTDGDGLTDFFEISRGMPFHDPANPDTDGDGASDSAQDTDGDGLDAATEQRL